MMILSDSLTYLYTQRSHLPTLTLASAAMPRQCLYSPLTITPLLSPLTPYVVNSNSLCFHP